MHHLTRRRGFVAALTAAVVALGGALVAAPAAQASTITTPDGGLPGVDVSGAANWANAPTNAKFAYIEATDNAKMNKNFYANWAGATQKSLARGAYSFGVPNKTASNGATQATYFYENGGALSTASPYSLPPVLDLESNPNAPSGSTGDAAWCWSLSVAQTQNWISEFAATFKKLSGVTPVIYTSKSYWQDCVGASTMLKSYPLWIVDTISTKKPTLGFGGWTSYHFWQYQLDDKGSQGGFDYDSFHGSLASLRALSTPRISGSDRYGTSLAAALSFKPGVSEVFAADSQNYPDALAAGAAAGKAGGPVLLVPPSGSLPASVRQALSYLKPKKIIVGGGTAAVSSSVSKALASYGPVARQDGADRYATSAAIAKNFPAGVANAYVAMGSDWRDALSGSALAASKQGSGPMLLVSTNSIPTPVWRALSALRPTHIYVLGGTAVVNSAVQSALAKYTATRASSSVSRLAGVDRYATSAAIASHVNSINGSATGPLYAASGTNFPDALVGSPVAALTSQPLLLVPPSSALPSEVRNEAKSLKAPSLAILGGKAAVSSSVQSALNGLVG